MMQTMIETKPFFFKDKVPGLWEVPSLAQGLQPRFGGPPVFWGVGTQPGQSQRGNHTGEAQRGIHNGEAIPRQPPLSLTPNCLKLQSQYFKSDLGQNLWKQAFSNLFSQKISKFCTRRFLKHSLVHLQAIAMKFGSFS